MSFYKERKNFNPFFLDFFFQARVRQNHRIDTAWTHKKYFRKNEKMIEGWKVGVTANNSKRNLRFWQQQFRDRMPRLESLPKGTRLRASAIESNIEMDRRHGRARQLFSFYVTSCSLVKFDEWFCIGTSSIEVLLWLWMVVGRF